MPRPAAAAQWRPGLAFLAVGLAGTLALPAGATARVLAGLSDRGPAGAEGRGSRFIYVHAVREARLPRADDCTIPGARP